MKRLLIPILLLTLSLPFLSQAQQTAALAKAVTDLSKDDAMKHASLSVAVYNISKRSAVYTYNAQQAMVPASVTKLFTTATGFEKLGSEFRFKTLLAYSGEIEKNGTLHGDIYIICGGDPLLGSYRYMQTLPDTVFAIWKRAISQAGIKAVNGRIYYDATIFDDQPLHNSWQWDDIGNYYGSGVTGLNFHENMFFVHFRPGSRVGNPAAIINTEPAGINVHTINEVATGPARSGDQVIVYGDPAATLRTCRGTVPVDVPKMTIRASLPKAAEVCASLFTSYLRNHQVSVSGAASASINRPANLVHLVEYTSPTYYVIAQYTNMTSNNTYAEAIHKYLGYKAYGLGSYANGAKVVKDMLSAMRLNMGGIKLEDGSGLSRCNRVTADFVCRFLMEMTNKTFFDDFQKSMALAGEHGTVRNMLNGLPANISVRMKSGSMDGVRNYVGYVTNGRGERYCFSVLCSDYDCTGTQMRAKLEKIILKIATLN